MVLEWRFPDDGDPRTEWRLRVELSGDQAGSRFALHIGRQAIDQFLAPRAEFKLYPPRIVRQLVEGYECYAGPSRLTVSEREITSAGTDDFMVQELAAESRVAPILMLADERPSVDRLSTLAGLCAIVRVTRLSWERLRDRFGYSGVPPWEGARLYWPGFPDAPVWHPWFRRSDVRVASFAERPFAMLSRLSAVRIPEDPIVAEFRRNELRELERQIRERGREIDHDFYLAYIDEIERDKRALDDEVSRLSAVIEQKQVQLEYQALNPPTPQESDSEEPDAPTTWKDAHARFGELESDALRFTDDVRPSLLKCTYPDVTRMWTQLMSLKSLAEAYRQSRGSLGGRLGDVSMETYGIELALTDKGLGKQRRKFEGKELDFTPHVKVDDVKIPKECGRIYFAIDKENARLVVDHVGLHK